MRYFNLTLIMIVLLFISCDTTEPPIEPPGNTVSYPFIDRHPVWSPDGKKIVYTDSRAKNGLLWIMNSDGSKPKQLTFN